jgi:katanin p60 ATPase-containing subunit A1
VDVRVLKGIPDYSDVPEYRELAAYLQRDILVENPSVRFEDIIGLDHAKTLIMEAVTLPIKYPQCFVGITEAWRGILLYGPPGTGKVLSANADNVGEGGGHAVQDDLLQHICVIGRVQMAWGE